MIPTFVSKTIQSHTNTENRSSTHHVYRVQDDGEIPLSSSRSLVPHPQPSLKSNHFLVRAHELTSLNLGGSGLGEGAGRALAEELRLNTVLTLLAVSWNGFGVEPLFQGLVR